jgi:hypothetical protein
LSGAKADSSAACTRFGRRFSAALSTASALTHNFAAAYVRFACIPLHSWGGLFANKSHFRRAFVMSGMNEGNAHMFERWI